MKNLYWAAGALSAMLVALPAVSVNAQNMATDRELSPVVVREGAAAASLDPTLPSSTHSVTREDLTTQSFINTEDALLYAPNTHVRKRFIGDRNANLSGRSFGTLQPARGLAYVDGYMISNFLGRFDAPRWSIVAPEQVARTDVLYGPFSAIYPGNSIGTTVAITTREPTGPEASATAQKYRQQHSDYGFDRTYGGDQQSVFAAHRRGDLAMSLALNRLAYASQPMSYATSAVSDVAAGGEPTVTGARFDRDPNGKPRAVFGATGMQTGVQEQATLRLAYDLTPVVQADMLFAQWRNDYRVRNQTFLRDASGKPYWRPGTGSPNVNIDGSVYAVPNMAPQKGSEMHQQAGGRLRTRYATGWNHSVQISRYALRTDSVRQSNVSDPFSAGVVAGTDTRRDGTGWNTFGLQSTYTPEAPGGHELTFGYHRSSYALRNRLFDLDNWNRSGSRTGERQNYFGKTDVSAIYAQDAWHFHRAWIATAGLRLERFRAHDGSQYDAVATSGARVNYANRKDSGVSPKLSLTHFLSDEWLLKASYGRGVRFPTVSELFQGTRSGNAIVSNDPDLKPERSDAFELSAIRELGYGSLRVSVFQDDVRDVIFQQPQLLGNGDTVTTVQNVDRVRTRGVEFAFRADDVLLRGLGFEGSVAFNESTTLSNSARPSYEGKHFPRIPRVRASVLTRYERGPWSGSLGARHSGRQYNTLDNADARPDAFGGVSSFTVVDAKLGYRFGPWGSLAVGIDNLTDRRYYVFHPYPGRTVYAELKLAYQ